MSRPEHKRRFSKHQEVTVYSNQPEPLQAEALYKDHYPQVKAFLLSRSNAPDLIEEVLQDLYLKLMKIDDLTQIDNPSAYLCRIAHNLLIDALRRQARAKQRNSNPVESDDVLALVDPQPSPFEATLSGQRLAACEQALSELPPEYREILLLNRVDRLTHSQIAKRYGRSVSWVEKTIVRTLAYCRHRLAIFD